MWGNLPVNVEIRPPISFLKEQASALTKETKGLLQGQVVVQSSGTPSLIASLDIVAPALNGYRVRVVTITHALAFYPLSLKNELTNQQVAVSSESVFATVLRQFLSSTQVHNVVGALIAQIKASEPSGSATS